MFAYRILLISWKRSHLFGVYPYIKKTLNRFSEKNSENASPENG
jgi:hypothetical protein